MQEVKLDSEVGHSTLATRASSGANFPRAQGRGEVALVPSPDSGVDGGQGVRSEQ